MKLLTTTFTLLLLTACSSPPETYQEKIARFESSVTSDGVDQIIGEALQESQSKQPDVELINYRTVPIPDTYKARYAELGFDVSQMTFEKTNRFTPPPESLLPTDQADEQVN